MSSNKTIPTKKSVIEFLDSIENQNKRADAYKLLQIMEELTGKEAVMWGSNLIGFDNYHYKYSSGREGDFFITGFSPRKTALTIYVMPGFTKYEAYLDKLGKHSVGKSCLYIKRLDDIDEQVLKNLIADSIGHMRSKYH